MNNRLIVRFFALVLGLVFAVSQWGYAEDARLRVGVCAGPYGELFLRAIAPSLAERGYDVELIEFSDYVQPNHALAQGELELNVFQHAVYLASFTEQHGLDLTAIAEVPTAGMGVFAQSLGALSELPDGATVAIPNDATNLARAIRVLQQAGLVEIDPAVDPAEANQYVLSQNPHNLQFIEIEAPQLPRSLESVDIAVINGNYALGAGLDLSAALFNEELQEGYVNVIAVRTEDIDAPFARDIADIVHSDAFRAAIDDPASPFASFFKPASIWAEADSND